MARKKSRPARPSAPATTTVQPPAEKALSSPPKTAENGSAARENGFHATPAPTLQETARPLTAPIQEAIQETNGTVAVRPSALAAGEPPQENQPSTQTAKEPVSRWSRFGKKAANVLGSLQLAVCLLTFFALVVLLGTLMEHWYNTKIAQELVYRSWWFNFLLLMLAVTIFFAATKKMVFTKEPLRLKPITATTFLGKVRDHWDQTWATMSHFWPWKRHQFGFIVTHIGLITMLAGGLLNNWFGVDAQLQLLDNSDAQVVGQVEDRMNGHIPQSANECFYSDTAEMRLIEEIAPGHGQKGVKGKTYAQDFWGGPFPWNHRHATGSRKKDTLLSFMNFVQNPLGNSWAMNGEDGVRLEVLDFIPLAKEVPFAKGEGGFPAFQLQFRTDKFVDAIDRWLSLSPDDGDLQFAALGPAQVEGLGRCPANLIPEFLKPPVNLFKENKENKKEENKKGVLSVHAAGKTKQLVVTENWKTDVELGSGWKLKIKGYVDDPAGLAKDPNSWLNDPEALKEKLESWLNDYGPALEVEVTSPKGTKSDLVLMAWRPDSIWDVAKGTWTNMEKGNFPTFLYHAPEVDRPLFKMPASGILQFVESTDGTLYFRTFTKPKDSKVFALEKSGAVDVENEKEYPIWDKMGWRFRVVEYIPQAKKINDFTAANIAPGKETSMESQMYRSVALCRLSVPGVPSKEFWLKKGSGQRVTLGDKKYMVRYDYKVQPLGFTLKLDRAITTRDAGTNAAATYSSYVQVIDPKTKKGENRLITMNEPLEHNGFTFYQSSLEFTGVYDANGQGKPVSISGFTVGSDPGLSLKYAGSLMLALGISIMFYMKAYFFPRRKVAAEPAQ